MTRSGSGPRRCAISRLAEMRKRPANKKAISSKKRIKGAWPGDIVPHPLQWLDPAEPAAHTQEEFVKFRFPCPCRKSPHHVEILPRTTQTTAGPTRSRGPPPAATSRGFDTLVAAS